MLVLPAYCHLVMHIWGGGRELDETRLEVETDIAAHHPVKQTISSEASSHSRTNTHVIVG